MVSLCACSGEAGGPGPTNALPLHRDSEDLWMQKQDEAKERLMGYFFKSCFKIEVELIYKVVLVSGTQKSDSDSHTQKYMSGLPWWLSGKESTCNAGVPGSVLESERFPGERNGNHSSILAWEIPWTEESGGLQSMGSQKSWT